MNFNEQINYMQKQFEMLMVQRFGYFSCQHTEQTCNHYNDFQAETGDGRTDPQPGDAGEYSVHAQSSNAVNEVKHLLNILGKVHFDWTFNSPLFYSFKY